MNISTKINVDDVSCFIIDQNVLTMAVSKSQNIAHWKNKEKTSDELEIIIQIIVNASTMQRREFMRTDGR